MKISKSLLVKKSTTAFLSLFERLMGCWVTYTLRPRKSTGFGHYPDPSGETDKAKVAIVMQGPVMEKWDFTLETLKMYKMMYPDVYIIVSTWRDTKHSVVEKLKKLGVHVVLSEYPDNPGISHVNYQIVSTKAGIQKAIELQVDYCLKTRTDQRMYRHDAINFLLGLLRVFPLNRNIYPQLKGRLIAMSLNTYKYRLYGVSDMFMFGYIEDMQMYWDVPHDTRILSRTGSNLLRYAKLRLCEVYFCALFIENLNIKLEWTLKHSWQMYKDLFCVIDTGMVDFYWPKYNRFLENRRRDYSVRKACDLLYFSDWLRFYSANSLNDEIIPENILRCSMDDVIIEDGL